MGATDGEPTAGAKRHRPLLIVGVMRSGTSWVSEVLGRSAGVTLLHEPDNPWQVPFAARAVTGLGALPVVERGAQPPADYARLWDVAFGARRGGLPNRRWPLRNADVPNRLSPMTWMYRRVSYPEQQAAFAPGSSEVSRWIRMTTRFALPASAGTGPNRVVKSVSAALALDWIVDRYEPDVLVVRRHPLDILASQVRLGWGGDPVDPRGTRSRLERWGSPPFPTDDDAFARRTWLVGFTMSALDESVESNPQFGVVDHEYLCDDSLDRFRALAAQVGLVWSDEAEAHLLASNRSGSGVQTVRLASELPGKWRSALSSDDAERAIAILSRFPIARRYAELV
jgi:hypothetical protein